MQWVIPEKIHPPHGGSPSHVDSPEYFKYINLYSLLMYSLKQ